MSMTEIAIRINREMDRRKAERQAHLPVVEKLLNLVQAIIRTVLGRPSGVLKRERTSLLPVKRPAGVPRATVIFVHGLGGDAFGTWQFGSDRDSFWPRWLNEDLPDVAVYTIAYPAAASEWLGSAMPLQDRAANVLEHILLDLDQLHGPIVFVCHSLGGLIVKQVLRKAMDQGMIRPSAAEFLRRVGGISFIATPHSGSSLASILTSLGPVLRLSSAARDVISNDPTLRDLASWHRAWSQSQNIRYRVFYEMRACHRLTPVLPDSAELGMGEPATPVDADHFEICKPRARSDLVYRKTLQLVVEVLEFSRDEQSA